MSNKLINWIIFVILCFIWGSSFILMKYSKDALSASQIAALRIFAAGVVFIIPAAIYLKELTSKQILYAITAGAVGNLIPAFLFAIAIVKNIDSSLAAIFNSLTPIFVVVIGILFYKDKIKANKMLGVLIGFAGLCLLVLTQQKVSFDNFTYSLLIVFATILYGLNVNIVSHNLKNVNPLHSATISLGFMTIPSAIVLWQQHFFELDFGVSEIRNAVVASALLGIVGSAIATALFYILVKRAGGLFASLVTYGIPFVAIIWGMADGEIINWVEFLCLGIILLGVYLANRPDKKEAIDLLKDLGK